MMNTALFMNLIDNLPKLLYFYVSFKPLTESEELKGNRSKRARGGEIRTARPLSEWTPEGAKERAFPSMLRRKACVSCRRYVGILLKRTSHIVNQGGTADKYYSSLT